MTIERTMYVIAVHDLLKSADWYQTVLNFSVREIGDPGWRIFEKDGCQVMAGECRDAMPARDTGDHSYFAYLEVDDATGYHERAVAAGADIIKPLRDEPWDMREFGLRTVDGHRIMIGEALS